MLIARLRLSAWMVVLGVLALAPNAALAAVSKCSITVNKEKGGYTINASLNQSPPPGASGEFLGTIVPAGDLAPDVNNLYATFAVTQGITYTRLSDDTVSIVDAKGQKFWVMMKSKGDTTTASISDGMDTLAKGTFRGVWYNDTGEAGAQSIVTVLGSLVAQQATPPNDPPKPTVNECFQIATTACANNGGIKTFTWKSDGTCSFECFRAAN